MNPVKVFNSQILPNELSENSQENSIEAYMNSMTISVSAKKNKTTRKKDTVKNAKTETVLNSVEKGTEKLQSEEKTEKLFEKSSPGKRKLMENDSWLDVDEIIAHGKSSNFGPKEESNQNSESITPANQKSFYFQVDSNYSVKIFRCDEEATNSDSD
jgi:hypothetical protein